LRHPEAGRIIEAAGDLSGELGARQHMTTIGNALRAGAILIPLALLVAACGGNTPSAAPSASGGTSSATGSPIPSTAPVATSAPSPPASSASAQSPATSGLPIPSFDLSQITKGLDKVDSYRIALTVGPVEQYKAVVVTKPVLARDITISAGTHIVVIGTEAWTAQGSEALKPVPAQLAITMFSGFDPSLLVGAFSSPQWMQSALDKGTEQKNGVSAHHLVIDSTTMVGGLSGIPPGASINLWIAEEGYLVAWESKGVGSAGDTSIEVTGVDDPANKVERPS
jgi:hypothetical protein